MLRWVLRLALVLAVLSIVRAQDVTSCAEDVPAPYACSDFITNAEFDWAGNQRYVSGDGDIWPIAWGPTDAQGRDLWTAWGDGTGWDGQRGSFGFSIIEGHPDSADLDGTDISTWCLDDSGDPDPEGCSSRGGKIDAMLAVDGNFFIVVQQQDTRVNNDWSTTVGYSDDRLQTFTLCDKTLFPRNELFQPRGAVYYGKNYEHGDPEYLYLLASGDRTDDDIYMFRIPRPAQTNPAAVCDTKDAGHVFTTWEFLSGPDVDGDGVFDGGTPTWSHDQDDAVAIFHDPYAAWSAQIQWIPELGRYILQVLHSPATTNENVQFNYFGLFESTQPWGPWKTIEYFSSFGEQVGVVPANCSGGRECFPLNWFINPKWTAADGSTLWGVWSATDSENPAGDHDNFNVLKATLTLATAADNTPPAGVTDLTRTDITPEN